MGRAGMKRKGRKRLPKVGSEANVDASVHARRKQVMGDVGLPAARLEGSGGGQAFMWIVGAIVVGLAVVGILTLILLD